MIKQAFNKNSGGKATLLNRIKRRFLRSSGLAVHQARGSLAAEHSVSTTNVGERGDVSTAVCWKYRLSQARGFPAGWYMLDVSADVLLIGRNLTVYDSTGVPLRSPISTYDGHQEMLCSAGSVLGHMRLGAHTASKRLIFLPQNTECLFLEIENAEPSQISPEVELIRVSTAFAQSRMVTKLKYAGALPVEISVSNAESYLQANDTCSPSGASESALYNFYQRLLERHVYPLEYIPWLRTHEHAQRIDEDSRSQNLVPPEKRPDFAIVALDTDTDIENIASVLISCPKLLQHNVSVLCNTKDISALSDLDGFTHENVHIVNQHSQLDAGESRQLILDCRADYLVFSSADSLLAERSLDVLIEYLTASDYPDLAYSDHDMIDHAGIRSNPVFKPEWNPEMLMSGNYIGRFFVISRSLYDSCGGIDTSLGDSMQYDLLLRCIQYLGSTPPQLKQQPDADSSNPHNRINELQAHSIDIEQAGLQGNKVIRIPTVLYHRQCHRSGELAWLSTGDRDVLALHRYLEQQFDTGCPPTDRQAEVVPGMIKGCLRVQRCMADPGPFVDIIIPTRDKVDVLRTCIESVLEKTSYTNFRLMVVDNDSVEQETRDYYKTLAENSRIELLEYDGAFNYSAINNYAVSQSNADVVVLLNNDTEVCSPLWLTELVSQSSRPTVGCVGAKLYYSNGLVQHAGVILGIKGVAGHAHRLSKHDSDGYCGRLKYAHNVSAVTAACLAVRRDVYNEVGGLDEVNLKVAYNDVDFCLRVQQAGYANIWTPYAELYHHESLSRGSDDTPEKAKRFKGEYRYMQEQWQTHVVADPAYNPNLALDQEDFSLAA